MSLLSLFCRVYVVKVIMNFAAIIRRQSSLQFCKLRKFLELEAGVSDRLIRELKFVVLCRRSDADVFLVVAVIFLKDTESTFVDLRLLMRLQKLDFVQTCRGKIKVR